MLYKVVVGRDEYLGSPEEVVRWMSRAEGAPRGDDLAAYMAGIAARTAERTQAPRVDASSPLAFLRSLAAAGLLRLEERPEPSRKRSRPDEALEGPVVFGEGVEPEDLEGIGGAEESGDA